MSDVSGVGVDLRGMYLDYFAVFLKIFLAALDNCKNILPLSSAFYLLMVAPERDPDATINKC
ncbi:hypothetical protein ACJJIU_04565 [Microbulbifer sp. CnH-101-E]|uniref:hypothetical protein n=1 Tax=unclassified Microbulbifer TaxID=2619833 RepID=UPI004039A682